jgi:hypothetical protein
VWAVFPESNAMKEFWLAIAGRVALVTLSEGVVANAPVRPLSANGHNTQPGPLWLFHRGFLLIQIFCLGRMDFTWQSFRICLGRWR